jgi:aminoglycoside 3-N-acetyltransferase I
MDYEYKRITPDDPSLLRRLIDVFAEVFDERETYLGSIPRDAYLRRLLERDTFIALAAMAGNEVVGGLAAYELEKFERERSEIYIYDLGVREGHRRRGVARNLIEELRAVARARGAWVIFVQADRGDTPAIRLYESVGTCESVYHFDIPV